MKIDDSLQITSKGKGTPRIVILTGVHGDEKSPLLVAEQLKKLKVNRGKLEIVGVNNKALRLNKRFVEKDLNRVFPGKPNGCHEEKLAFKLASFLKDTDLVIDLHCFHSKTCITAIQFKDFDKNVKIFDPEQVWNVSNGYDGAIGVELSKLGVEGFGVELNCLANLRNKEIDLVVSKLVAVLLHNGLGLELLSKGLIRHRVVCKGEGLFIPFVSPLEKVSEGQIVGEILRGSNKNPIPSPISGEVMQVSNSKICKKGDFLLAVGESK